MTTMNVSLPESMKNFVDSRTEESGYSTASEYVRDLIRADQVRQAEKTLINLMREGLESGTPISVDNHYWYDKRKNLKKRNKK